MIKRLTFLLIAQVAFAFAAVPFFAADAAPASAAPPAAASDAAASSAADAAVREKAAAAVAAGLEPRPPDFLEHLVDVVLDIFNIRTSGNTGMHYAISALLLVLALAARRIVTRILFVLLRKVASTTRTTLDDKLFLALEGRAAAFVMLIGIFAALKVLKLSPVADEYISNGSRVAMSLAVFWLLWRGLTALLEHAHEYSKHKQLGIASFMPWI